MYNTTRDESDNSSRYRVRLAVCVFIGVCLCLFLWSLTVMGVTVGGNGNRTYVLYSKNRLRSKGDAHDYNGEGYSFMSRLYLSHMED